MRGGALRLTGIPEAVLSFLLSGIGATVLLLLPGYLLTGAYGRGVRGPALSERAFVASTAGAGVVVHLLALPWTLELGRRIVNAGPGSRMGEIVAWLLVVLFAVPVALGAAFAALSERTRPPWLHRLLVLVGVSSSVRTAEAWNWVFRQGFPAYVRVRLKDGTIVLGRYGTQSFASSDAANGDLYLEEQWSTRDGWFDQPLETNLGIWLRGSEIVSIEFFAGRDAPEELPKGAEGES
ncbi:DUF6338 family protein [Micromonospora sp. NPDC005173]|uniref:DUF6338 family protein n=1 Tax=Micromonospora sp. NPDC005173 TaxID=3157165 RepID=UPI0033BC0337